MANNAENQPGVASQDSDRVINTTHASGSCKNKTTGAAEQPKDNGNQAGGSINNEKLKRTLAITSSSRCGKKRATNDNREVNREIHCPESTLMTNDAGPRDEILQAFNNEATTPKQGATTPSNEGDTAGIAPLQIQDAPGADTVGTAGMSLSVASPSEELHSYIEDVEMARSNRTTCSVENQLTFPSSPVPVIIEHTVDPTDPLQPFDLPPSMQDAEEIPIHSDADEEAIHSGDAGLMPLPEVNIRPMQESEASGSSPPPQGEYIGIVYRSEDFLRELVDNRLVRMRRQLPLDVQSTDIDVLSRQSVDAMMTENGWGQVDGYEFGSLVVKIRIKTIDQLKKFENDMRSGHLKATWIEWFKIHRSEVNTANISMQVCPGEALTSLKHYLEANKLTKPISMTYCYEKCFWYWTADLENWQTTETILVNRGFYVGKKPMECDVEALQRLEEYCMETSLKDKKPCFLCKNHLEHQDRAEDNPAFFDFYGFKLHITWDENTTQGAAQRYGG